MSAELRLLAIRSLELAIEQLSSPVFDADVRLGWDAATVAKWQALLHRVLSHVKSDLVPEVRLMLALDSSGISGPVDVNLTPLTCRVNDAAVAVGKWARAR